mmetsp:Transcript_776/g.1290  ORF Transcript_776/g.1290 Transcript_776/m.1290 type:complete len:198 (+) Transcript_776:76-669(+)
MAGVEVKMSLSFKTLLHISGALVNAAIIFQAVWVFSQPQGGDISKFCNWLGQGLLFLVAGLAGIAFEIWSMKHNLPKTWTALGVRMAVAVYYFWLGCCAIGGVRKAITPHEYAVWSVVDLVIGICAWTCAGVNLTAPCWLKTDVEEDEKMFLSKSISSSPPQSFQAGTASSAKSKSPFAESCHDAEIPVPPGGWNKI